MQPMIFPSFLLLASTAVGAPMASLQEVTGFGSNPSNIKMFVYVPDRLATKPAILVAAHACQNTAASTFGSTPYKGFADQKGFIVIYPQSAVSGACWDVSSKSSLSHNGAGSSNSIANMVTYGITKYNADASKVFFVGLSSGAMMANVMAATYPELFNAIIVHSGVPAGCFVSASNQVATWNGTCSGGKTSHTPQEWATVVKNMYPGYSGS
ncbi:esterase PHB depolymerase-domain-containing protein [Clohesyomyces aquaticus]|uniref:Esterase PHB depolymerase-domain-containing protein n=1 Tax=Clohesyomyces aquaticus TaxID=1231657 RepID=A0A1Y1YJB2_9PLEO|nr:esterase PHB depolymerase-domain-containing protein [Clohesyomyces aquaticus]